MSQPSFPALFYERQSSALLVIQWGSDSPQNVYDGMLVMHNLLQLHHIGKYLGETAVYLTCNLQTVT